MRKMCQLILTKSNTSSEWVFFERQRTRGAACPSYAGAVGRGRQHRASPQPPKLVAVIRPGGEPTLFYQQLAQCKAIYDKKRGNHFGQHRRRGGIPGAKASTIKEISGELAGEGHHLHADRGPPVGSPESYNQNTQTAGPGAYDPAELATMPEDKCILQLQGPAAVLFWKYDLKTASQLPIHGGGEMRRRTPSRCSGSI